METPALSWQLLTYHVIVKCGFAPSGFLIHLAAQVSLSPLVVPDITQIVFSGLSLIICEREQHATALSSSPLPCQPSLSHFALLVNNS